MTETKQRMPAAERREMVLDAAVAEFAVHGLAGTPAEDAARGAGISQPYLFRLFPTKKALFLALVDQCYRRVADTLTPPPRAPTPPPGPGGTAEHRYRRP